MDKDYYEGVDSGTDYAQYRQYGETPGRWMSPDPYYGSYDVNNPQRMNRYSYVLNNPLVYVDPDGTSGPCNDNGGGCSYPCPPGGGQACVYGNGPISPPTQNPPPPSNPCDGYSCSGDPGQGANDGQSHPGNPGGSGAGGRAQQGASNGGQQGKSHAPQPVPSGHCNSACHPENTLRPVPPANPCVVLAIASVPLAATGVPEVAGLLELSAGAVRALAWVGVGGSVAGLGRMSH